MNYHELQAILFRITFQDWHFKMGQMGDGFFIQSRFLASDTEGGIPTRSWQSGRKWYVSPHSTESEVIQTALKAILTAVEHEAREQFLVDGKAIFGPHLDVEALLELADRTTYREPVAA